MQKKKNVRNSIWICKRKRAEFNSNAHEKHPTSTIQWGKWWDQEQNIQYHTKGSWCEIMKFDLSNSQFIWFAIISSELWNLFIGEHAKCAFIWIFHSFFGCCICFSIWCFETPIKLHFHCIFYLFKTIYWLSWKTVAHFFKASSKLNIYRSFFEVFNSSRLFYTFSYFSVLPELFYGVFFLWRKAMSINVFIY